MYCFTEVVTSKGFDKTRLQAVTSGARSREVTNDTRVRRLALCEVFRRKFFYHRLSFLIYDNILLWNISNAVWSNNSKKGAYWQDPTEGLKIFGTGRGCHVVLLIAWPMEGRLKHSLGIFDIKEDEWVRVVGTEGLAISLLLSTCAVLLVHTNTAFCLHPASCFFLLHLSLLLQQRLVRPSLGFTLHMAGLHDAPRSFPHTEKWSYCTRV